MQLELNGRTYFLLAAIIAVGLFLEALKFWPANHPLGAAEQILQLSQPYSVSEKTIRQTTKILTPGTLPEHLPPPVVLPELNLKDQISKWQAEQDKLKAEEDKRKKAAKNWHWVWNKKLQRWEWKKKKKKKKTDTKQAGTQTADSSSDSTSSDKSDASKQPADPAPAAFTNQAKPTAAFGAPAGASTAPHKFLSAQEWLDYLENSPSQSKTDNFVQQYKQHLVTEQVFYQVVGNMLKSNKINVQQQGIYALGKTPSMQSFTMLANESNTLQTSSPLYQSTNQALSQYAKLQNLNVLQQALGQSSQNQGVTSVALKELQASISTNLGSAPSQQPSTQNANASRYQGFVPELTRIANSGSPSASQAGQILGTLASFGIH